MKHYSIVYDTLTLYFHSHPVQFKVGLGFIGDLENQGYEYLGDLNTPSKMLANVRVQLEALNRVSFLDSEWMRFVAEYLDKPSDNVLDKTNSDKVILNPYNCGN